MTRFDRTAYLARLGQLCGDAMNASRKSGMAICGHDQYGNPADLQKVEGDAHQAFLDALYSMPLDLHGTPVKRSAA